MTFVGRPLAGLFDLLTILVLYAVASKLYDKRVGLLAAAFSAFAVLQIQLSHFFTVDLFANFFIWLALYFGVKIAGQGFRGPTTAPSNDETSQPAAPPLLITHYLFPFLRHPLLIPILLFGLITGAAAASKISAFPIAFFLPVAVAIYFSRISLEKRTEEGIFLLVVMALSGALAALTFRIFQPYAFAGPGFFNLSFNPQWLDGLRQQSNLREFSSGFPPSVQWFDRPLWFSGMHLTLFGLGLPLGLAAWAGLIWMGWKIFRGAWASHLLVWLWVAAHFLWQSTVPNPTMRYQLPIYPGLALMAAWLFVTAWDGAKNRRSKIEDRRSIFDLRSSIRVFTVLFGAVVLVLTALYAYAFTGIYTRDITRIAASRWMYQNIPGAIQLNIENAGGGYNQPLSFPNGFAIRIGEPYNTSFVPREGGTLQRVQMAHIEPVGSAAQGSALFLGVSEFPDGSNPIATAMVSANFAADAQGGVPLYAFGFGEPVPLAAFKPYFLTLELVGDAGQLEICQPLSLQAFGADGVIDIPVAPPENCTLSEGTLYIASFTSEADGGLSSVILSQPLNYNAAPAGQTVRLEIASQPDFAVVLAQATLDLSGPAEDAVFTLDNAVALDATQTYYMRLSLESAGLVGIYGAVLGTETSWDDALPMRIDEYDGYGGIYRGDNNLELYWEDNAEKRERIVSILNRVDVLQVSSSRQWGSLTRLPSQWPLVQAYYRHLIGCPNERTVEWCFNVAQPGTFTGDLGFELVQVFESRPSIGGFSLNDQFSEEAFTVYDHPKVFIFLKSENYDPNGVRAVFDGVALPVAGASPEAGASPAQPIKPLLLPEKTIKALQSSGTWGDLFNRESWINRFQPLTVLAWYAAVALLGLAAYPLLRAIFPGLHDRGYPLARTAGLLLFSYLAWLAGSFGLGVTRLTLGLLALLVLVAGAIFAIRQWDELRQEWRERRNYFLIMETLALVFFIFFLIVRMGNPDLWHPWKGGEKPMDFAYFNAVLRSETFPPYDPWFAGGYINYYYYGFVYVGMLVKLLGIVPAVAYNLIIPTMFSLVGLGAFSLGWNLLQATRARKPHLDSLQLEAPADGEGAGEPRPYDGGGEQAGDGRVPYLAGLAASLGVAALGNLGMLKMLYQGYQRIAATPGAILDETFFLTRWVWGVRGFVQALSSGASLPYGIGDWYWFPSRAIPVPPGDIEPITEFPFFTFVYGDLHAHMLALPLTLLALTWALAILLGKARWPNRLDGALAFVFGGLFIGVLRPTNTWDYPTYLLLGILAVAFAAARYYKPDAKSWFASVPRGTSAAIAAISGVLWLAGLSWFMFQPFTNSYALGYADTRLWDGAHTPLNAFLIHWGPFIFLIVSWMLWETRAWLAATPAASGLRVLRKLRELILAGLVLFIVLIVGLTFLLKIEITWFVLPLAGWAAILMFRPGLPDAKRGVLFLIGTGLFLTLMVETIVLSGDIGRMNTVFKFYLQVWILFGVSAAASLGWLLPVLSQWKPAVGRGWRLALGALVFCMAMYPLLGSVAKIRDRIAEAAPVTLDGMRYMEYANYFERDRELLFAEDYRAILWLQENVIGTPTIVEAQIVEYRWGSRISINTGLPAVLGWNWHQRQQRTGHDGDVWLRASEIEQFYLTTDIALAQSFLKQYGVRYIIVGQLERAYYDGPGLDKFPALNGQYWREVYRDGQTAIYEVISDE